MCECQKVNPDSFVYKVMDFAFKNEMLDELLWYTKEGFIYFSILCNDLFLWALADSQPLTPDNFGELEKAFKDSRAACKDGDLFAPQLFCCRARGLRPQKPYYRHIPKEMHQMFDDCGPEIEDLALSK